MFYMLHNVSLCPQSTPHYAHKVLYTNYKFTKLKLTGSSVEINRKLALYLCNYKSDNKLDQTYYKAKNIQYDMLIVNHSVYLVEHT